MDKLKELSIRNTTETISKLPLHLQYYLLGKMAAEVELYNQGYAAALAQK